MVEQKIEDAVLAKLEAALPGLDAQYAGQLNADQFVKGLESGVKPVIIMAKSAPRQYTSPTIPTCQIEVTVNVLARADLDWNGMKYLDVISKATSVLEQWQKCLQDTHEDFSFENEFRCVGFQLGGGQYSFDP